MKWPWQDGGYNRKAHGAYSVTKFPRPDGCDYLAWFTNELLATLDSFAEAESVCVGHSEARESL